MDSNTLFLIVMVGFMALLMWNSSRNRKKQAAALAEKLAIGAEVMLGSGIFGTIEAIADDRIVVKSGTSTLEVARGAIARVTKTADENAAVAKPAVAKKAPAKAVAKPAAKTAAKKPVATTAAKKAK
jgi:preprotein translocase subunit YajC